MSALDRLRTPFFVAALVLIVLVVLIETGSSAVRGEVDESVFAAAAERELQKNEELRSDPSRRRELVNDVLANLRNQSDSPPPGLAIAYSALLDGLVLYSIGLMAVSLLLGERIHGRIQGVITLIVSLLILLATILLIIAAFIKLLIMLALLMAPPFGTLAYLAKYAFFNRTGAEILLSSVMLIKLGFVVCLVLAHQRFLQNKTLVLIILTSLLATLIVGFLHGLVPLMLVSVTDAVAAIVVGILAAIWAIVYLIESLVSIVRAVV